MTAPAPASELERRKRLRIRLRPDLAVEEQKYEGRTFYVVKDPISLRYYRLKDNEHFLLQFLDGKHTLEEAQKAYEKEYRPERLKLEDLEGFAQQLLTAGLALSESPKAGQQLYERRGKRRRTEFLQALTNILYIKIPVFDPERILNWLLKYVGFIFSMWFFVLSVAFMLSAVLLVATHFDTFRRKLPDYHEFFSLKTVVYLYISLGVVKIIHEFGHGLSCKRFGGEVHEMGALLMCFSPALYCNVSDSWVLPNKWHRIIISAAGIYVELLIAAIATFVWWYTPTQPFINNLALSLMVVCSVSTVVFNANPLMRYDGYYVLADWLEIPNLREKSNRYLSHAFQRTCLGIEVPDEEYMELWRKVLFISYAIVSWIYRWVVTFGILYLFSTFLKPYKLDVIGNLLAVAAVFSMTIWPAYNLCKSIHKRGRLPDMKAVRVAITASIAIAIVLFLALVPVPISRVRGLALVQAGQDASSQVQLRRPAFLTHIMFQPGDTVRKGQELARFRDPDLEEKIFSAQLQYKTARQQEDALEAQKKKIGSSVPSEFDRIELDRVKASGDADRAAASLKALRQAAQDDLVLVAPRDGVIGRGPRLDDIGKMFEGAREQGQAPPVFTINEPGKLRLCVPLDPSDYNQIRANIARARRRLKGQDPPPLSVTLRVHGLADATWQGRLVRMEESAAKSIDLLLSSRAGGPVAVKAPSGKTQELIPQAQHFLAYVEIDDPSSAIPVNGMAQVKIYLEPETCLSWAWRKLNDMLNLRLI
jgi:putative peptide zinc metalloprotease protein